MKKAVFGLAAITLVSFLFGQSNAKGPLWLEQYVFDKCNTFKIEFYAKKGELMKTARYSTHYQTGDSAYLVRLEAERKGSGMETLIDKKNMTAVQMFGTGGGATPMYNAGMFKYPGAEDLKKLELVATDQTKDILGMSCKKYTYTHKKIFGEVWITSQITLPNDIGVFRACKMAALHNTLSVTGFVMEMTTEDKNGGKTLMTTLSLEGSVSDTVSFKNVEISKAINTLNYYTF